jgi:hypothetical protein
MKSKSAHKFVNMVFKSSVAFPLGLSALAIAATALTVSLPTPAIAQGSPGLTIFSGVDRENELRYSLDNGGQVGMRDRYRLRIPADKLELAVQMFTVSYPDTYEGRFDEDRVEVEIDGDEIELEEVVWDQENRVIEIYPVEPVAAGSRVEIILSNVRNPRNIGTHYFNALVLSPGDLPLPRYIGTWILSFDRGG